MPSQQGKLSPETLNANQVATRLEALSSPLAKGLAISFTGIAEVCANEICAQLCLDAHVACHDLNWGVIAPKIVAFFINLHGKFAPVVLVDDHGEAVDFFPFPYLTFHSERQQPKVSLSKAMDTYYLDRDLHARMRQRITELNKQIVSAMEKLEKKQGLLLDVLSRGEKAEDIRLTAELLTANLHTITQGQHFVSLPNYYDPEMREVTIALSAQLTPVQNTQKYYTQYRKVKVAAEHAQAQLGITKDSLAFLNNLLDDLDKCESSLDLKEIRHLLAENGYIKPEPQERRKKKNVEGKPYCFMAKDGTKILVGKNSIQNDRITMRAKGNETWFHAHGIAGSHVIVCSEGRLSENTIRKAAGLAVYYSKGRNEPSLQVDYTKRKHIKKPAGSPAGFVTYTHYSTIDVGLTSKEIESIAMENTRRRWEESRMGY